MYRAILFLGVGGPGGYRPAANWDWWPLVGIVIALVIGWRSLGLWLSVPLFIASVAAGLLFAALVHAWGVMPALALSLFVGVVLRRITADRSPRRRPQPPRHEV